MRRFNHCMAASKSGKSVTFKVTVDDRFGIHTYTLASTKGWRVKFVVKHLAFESEKWDDGTVMRFVGLHVVKAASDRFEALRYLEQLKTIGNMEVHFWASKFLTNKNACKAWTALYR